jgi:hypothetical protein
MKKIVALGFLVLTIRTSAKISIGADGISLAAGTTLYAEGLTLTPQGNFNVTTPHYKKALRR